MYNKALKNYHRYNIKLKDKAIESIYMNGRKLKRFEQPDKPHTGKLYVVKSGSEIVYIGQTKQNMRRRLYDGLKGKYRYMWKDLPEVCILIWSFDGDGEDSEYLETIEG